MRTLPLRQLVGVSLWLALAVTISMVWIGHAQQPSAPGGDDPRFTGKTATLEAKDLVVSRRQFDANARSAWHSHDRGQLIFVEEGRARVQRRGEAMKELSRGDSDYTGPSVEHWHGAAPTQALTQTAVGFGGETKWLAKVTDAEYGGAQSTASAGRCYELRTYTAAPGKLQALHARFRDHTTALFIKHGMTVIGYWEPTEVPDTLIYLLAYKDRAARDVAWKAFGSDPDWIKARTASEVDGRLTTKIEAVFLNPTDYSPMK